jgi:hypothetical protein
MLGNAILDMTHKCKYNLEECVNMIECLRQTLSALHLGVDAHWFTLHCFSGRYQEIITAM